MLKEKKYSCFIPKISNLDARKKWIISSLSSKGKIYIDAGAIKAILNGKSLLAAGIKKVSGKFMDLKKCTLENMVSEND